MLNVHSLAHRRRLPITVPAVTVVRHCMPPLESILGLSPRALLAQVLGGSRSHNVTSVTRPQGPFGGQQEAHSAAWCEGCPWAPLCSAPARPSSRDAVAAQTPACPKVASSHPSPHRLSVSVDGKFQGAWPTSLGPPGPQRRRVGNLDTGTPGTAKCDDLAGWCQHALSTLQNVMIWQVDVSLRCQLCRRSAEMHQDKRGKGGGWGERGEQNATAMTVKIVMVKRGKKFLLQGLKVWSIVHKESHMRQSPAVLEEQASQEQTECLAPCCSPQSNNLEGPVP